MRRSLYKKIVIFHPDGCNGMFLNYIISHKHKPEQVVARWQKNKRECNAFLLLLIFVAFLFYFCFIKNFTVFLQFNLKSFVIIFIYGYVVCVCIIVESGINVIEACFYVCFKVTLTQQYVASEASQARTVA